MYRLLIVDDERLDREGLANQINWEQYGIIEIRMAKNSLDALEQYKAFPAEIVFTDVKMPGMNGIELAEHIKQLNPEVVIAFVSGYDDFSFLKSAIQLKAFEYILKPVQTDELTAIVDKLMTALSEKQCELRLKQELVNFTNLFPHLNEHNSGIIPELDETYYVKKDQLLKAINNLENEQVEACIHDLFCWMKEKGAFIPAIINQVC